jgi:hypothetical protein
LSLKHYFQDFFDYFSLQFKFSPDWKSIIQPCFCARIGFMNQTYFDRENLSFDFPFDFIKKHFSFEIAIQLLFITEKRA